jgi:hypothetical protein
MSTVKIFGVIIGLLILAWVISPPDVKPHLVYAGLIANLFFSFFIHNQTRLIMPELEQWEAVITRIDTSTDNIATELRDLKEQLKDKGLPKDIEDKVFAKLDTAATKLEAVGKPVDDGNGGTLPGDGTTPGAGNEAGAEGGGASQG